MALNSAQSIFNLIRVYASQQYKDTVPALTDKSPIGDVATPILTQPLVFKEFSILLGAFIKDYVNEQIWNNPLIELFTNTVRPLGEFSREIAGNPVEPRKYDPTHPERVLQYAMSDDKVLYYVRNVKEYFKVSIAMEDMQGAFTTYEDFNSYVSMKIAQQISGKQISMFNHIFEAIDANLKAGALVTLSTKAPEALTTDDIKSFTKNVKSLAKKFKFPSTSYNKYGSLEGANGDFKGWSLDENVIIIATIDYLTAVDVEYLASAFNLDKAEIKNRIYEVDNFDYDVYTEDGNGNPVLDRHVTSDIQAIVCDRRLFRFSRDLDMNTERFNEETLVTSYWSHAWYTYGINVMANNTVFVSDGSAPTGSDIITIPYNISLNYTDNVTDTFKFLDTKTNTYITPDNVTDFTIKDVIFDGSYQEVSTEIVNYIKSLVEMVVSEDSVTISITDVEATNNISFIIVFNNGAELVMNIAKSE